jgi:hypothetical protein
LMAMTSMPWSINFIIRVDPKKPVTPVINITL